MSSGLKVSVTDRDTGWAALFKRAKDAKDGRVKVGVLADDAKGDVETEGGLTVAELATVLHYGTSDGQIPPRPFLSMAFDEQRPALTAMGDKLISAVITGAVTAEKALNLMGLKLATEAKRVISVGAKLAPNAPSTVAQKGSARPLVDTGRLLGAITWAIEKGSK